MYDTTTATRASVRKARFTQFNPPTLNSYDQAEQVDAEALLAQDHAVQFRRRCAAPSAGRASPSNVDLLGDLHRNHRQLDDFPSALGPAAGPVGAACPASTIFAGWRQSVLPVHLLGLDALLGSVGAVAGDVKLQDDGVVHDPVNRRGGGHGVGKDALPL